MAAGQATISIEQGANFELLLTLNDSEGVALDLTGHTFRGQIRKTYSDSAIQASFSFDVLDQTDAGTKGKVTVSLTAVQTAAIAVPTSKTSARAVVSMIYDIESVIAGTVTRWLQGTAEISPEVTK